MTELLARINWEAVGRSNTVRALVAAFIKAILNLMGYDLADVSAEADAIVNTVLLVWGLVGRAKATDPIITPKH